jgi:hypothetical protein
MEIVGGAEALRQATEEESDDEPDLLVDRTTAEDLFPARPS